MKILMLVLGLFSLPVNAAQTKKSAPSKSHQAAATTENNYEAEIRREIQKLKPEDRETLGRMVSFTLLLEIKVNMNAFLNYRDEKALSRLLRAWSPEERADIKKELLAITETPTVRFEGSSLLFSLKDQVVEFQVVDPFDGVFRINGHRIRINPLSKYSTFKEQLDSALNASFRPPWIEAIFPEAQAGIGSMAAEGAAKLFKFVKPASAAAGGTVKEEAVVTGDRIGDEFMYLAKKGREEALDAEKAAKIAKRKEFIRNNVSGVAVGSTISALGITCIGFATDWKEKTNHCANMVLEVPAKVMCSASKEKKKDCVENVGALDAQVKASDDTSTVRTVLRKESECVPKGNGFTKKFTLDLVTKNEIARASSINPDAPPPVGAIRSSIQIEYEPPAKNTKESSKDSKETNKDTSNKMKTMVETLTTNECDIQDQTSESAKELAKCKQLQNSQKRKPQNQDDQPLGKIAGQRIWTFDGDNFTVKIFKPLFDDQGNFIAYDPTVQEEKCNVKNLSKECKLLSDQTLGSLGQAKDCVLHPNSTPKATIEMVMPPRTGGR
jgi:hypothetical protein